MEPMSDYAQLQLHFVDSVQRRYEVIRPIVLIGDRTAAQRAEETHLHPETIRDWARRFRHQGMLGLFPEQTAIVTPSRGRAVPEVVVEELARLKALYLYFPVKRAMFMPLRAHQSTTPLPSGASGVRVPLLAGAQLGTAFCEIARAALQSLRNAPV